MSGDSGAGPMCTTRDFICNPAGFPFIVAAVAVSDSCAGLVEGCAATENPNPGDTTVSLTQPEAGALCMAGTVKPGGWAQFLLHLAPASEDGTRILQTFNADRLGMTQAAFIITISASHGVGVTAGITKKLACQPQAGDFCWWYGFSLMIAPDSSTPVSITESGPTRAAFANFRQTDRSQGDPNQIFDTKAIQYIGFNLGGGTFDFCVRDFRFLDANDIEVTQGNP